MYFLFRFKNWKPTEYINLSLNERMVVKEFMYRELADREEEHKAMWGE